MRHDIATSGHHTPIQAERAPGAGLVDPTSSQHPLEVVLSDMSAFFESRGFAPRTRRLYLSRVRHLVTETGRSPLNLEPEELTAYLGAVQRCRGSATFAQVRTALNWVWRRYERGDLAIITSGVPATAPAPARTLNREERRLLFAAFVTGRDRLLFGLVAGLGLRPREAVALCVRDVDPVRATVRVIPNGTDTARELPIPSLLLGDLRNEIRGRYPHAPVFPGLAGMPLSLRTVQKRLGDAVRRAGLRGRVTSTVLRRCAAAETQAD